MYYELRRYTVKPSLAQKFQSNFAQDLLPVLEANGFDFVGAWTIEVGDGSAADLLWMLRWESLADRQTAYKAVRSDPRNESFRKENLEALISSSSQLLRPTQFSPLA